MSINNLKQALRKNLEWFTNSGVMLPPDGSWGVAERVAITRGNGSIGKMFSAFPAYMIHDGYAIIEQRRPDCNFETALMFLLANKVFGDKKYFRIAENILIYLYCRSGMRNNKSYKDYPDASWKWSNISWNISIFFDDNSWNCVIPLIIAKMHPGLDKKFNMRESALALASELERNFNTHFNEEDSAKIFKWAGNVKSPHWGSLAVMTFAFAFRETSEKKYEKAIFKYNDYLMQNKNAFTTSEHAYILLGNTAAAFVLEKNKRLVGAAELFADMMLSKMDDAGNIHSEWAREAPAGTNLVDMVYTQNWALVALQSLYSLTKNKKYGDAFRKALELVVSIQDKSAGKQFKGCWRGMYDMQAGEWGGGDRYEGGAGSIYTGWTNAPISITIANELLKKTFFK